MSAWTFTSAACLLATLVSGCSRPAASAIPGPASDAGATGRPSPVTLNAAQLAELRIETVADGGPADAIHATGAVEFNADRVVRVVAPVSGQVQELDLNIGDAVRQGSVLFVLNSREAAAAIADFVASRTDLDLAVKTHAMTEDLYNHQVASRMSLDQSQSELEKARAKVAQSREVLQVLGLDATGDAGTLESRVPVRAPISGVIVDRTAANGQYVGPENSPVVTVADLSTVWIEADVFERDLGKIAIGQSGDVTTTAYPNDHFTARVSRIGAVVDPQTRTAKVRFLVANPDLRLKPGMFTATSLELARSPGTLSVPSEAAFVEGNDTFVFVQEGPSAFERRAIRTSAAGGDRLSVVSGLKAGDRVVSRGVLFLQQLELDAPSR